MIGPAHNPTRMTLLGRVAPSLHAPFREGQTIPLEEKIRREQGNMVKYAWPGLSLWLLKTRHGKAVLLIHVPMNRSGMSGAKSHLMTQRIPFTPPMSPRPVPALCLRFRYES